MVAPEPKCLSFQNVAERAYLAAHQVHLTDAPKEVQDEAVEDVKYYLSLLAVGSASPKLLHARKQIARETSWEDISSAQKLPYYIFAGVVSGVHYAAWNAKDGFYVGDPEEEPKPTIPPVTAEVVTEKS